MAITISPSEPDFIDIDTDSEEFALLLCICQHIWLNRLDSDAFVFDQWFLECLAGTFETSVTRVEREMIRALVSAGLLQKTTIRDGGRIAGHRYRVPNGCIWVLDECGERTDPALRVPEGQERAEPAAVDPVAATKAHHAEKLSALAADPSLARWVDILAGAYVRQAGQHAKLLRGDRVPERDIRHVEKLVAEARKALGLDRDSKARERDRVAKSLQTVTPGRLLSDYANEVERMSEEQVVAMQQEEERAYVELADRMKARHAR
jgi:hypothetical protein